jgi:hypothetical protein
MEILTKIKPQPNLFVCIHGIIGGSKGKNGKGKSHNVELLYNHINNYVITPNSKYYNNIVFIIHSWSKSHSKEIIKYFKPINYLFQTSPYKERRLSKLTSLFQSINLLGYLQENDVIFHTRFDNYYNKSIILDPSTMDNNNVYVAGDDPGWVSPKKSHYKDLSEEKIQEIRSKRVCDNFFFGKGISLKNIFNQSFYDKIINLIKHKDESVINPLQQVHGDKVLDNHAILNTIFKNLNIIKLNNFQSKVDIDIFRNKKLVKI